MSKSTGFEKTSSLESQSITYNAVNTNVQNPFPTILWKAVLVMAVFIYGAHSVIVTLSKENGKIPYSSSSVVFFIELCKLLFSLAFLSQEIIAGKVQNQPLKSWLAFSVPAVLYCINNNLSVHVLLFIDPASYQILINVKIVTTALIYRAIIKRSISRTKWIALLLITFAGICNSYGGIKSSNAHSNDPTASPTAQHEGSSIYVTFTGIILVLLISTISGFAGVYTEYIVKRQFQISIHQQNCMLYTFGVLFNLLTFLSFLFSASSQGAEPVGYISAVFGIFLRLFSGYNKWAVLLIFSEACGGLILSAVMKYASNITKLFIIASAMIVTTSLSMILFSLQINVYFLISFCLVIYALFLNQNG